MLKTTRQSAGHYICVIDGITYIISRTYDWDTCLPDGFWTFRAEYTAQGIPGIADDIFCTKRDALLALEELTKGNVSYA